MHLNNPYFLSFPLHLPPEHRLEIEEAFIKIGPIRNIWVAKEPPSFAYVEMEDPRDAEDAMKALHNTEICGMRARVEMAKEGFRV